MWAEPHGIKVLVQTVYNILAIHYNMYSWGLVDKPAWPLCQKKGALELRSCPKIPISPADTEMTRRSGQIVKTTYSANTIKTRPLNNNINFIRAGKKPDVAKLVAKRFLRPDIALATKNIVMVELLMPLEERSGIRASRDSPLTEHILHSESRVRGAGEPSIPAQRQQRSPLDGSGWKAWHKLGWGCWAKASTTCHSNLTPQLITSILIVT